MDPDRSCDENLRDRLRALEVFAGDLPSFEAARAPEYPSELFQDWLNDAIEAGLREPHAMTLSTVDAAARPSARVLILKDIAGGRWRFASSRISRKGIELAVNPWAAATIYWSELGRQVRLRGRVHALSAAASAEDFLARSPGSRAESLSGRQSDVLHDTGELDRALAAAHARIDRDAGVVAEQWTLYELDPDEIEFWQADRQRRHIRLRYRCHEGRWMRELLWP